MYIHEKPYRPKLKLALSNLEKFLFITSALCIIALWYLSIISYINLPKIVATHFNFSGSPDSYGSKNVIFIFPIIASIMYVLFATLSRLPHILNYTVKITVENVEAQYRNARTLMLSILGEVSLLFLFLQRSIVNSMKNNFSHSELLFLPLFLIIFFSTIIYFIRRMIKLK